MTARFWHDLRPGDRHWTVADTGWAKAAWGGLFGQWHEEATVVQVALGKPDADTILGIISGADDHQLLRAADPLPPARAGRPRRPRPLPPAPLHQRRRAAQPGGDPRLEEGVGLTIYDGYGQSETTLMVANYRCLPVRPGSMGKPVPGWDVDVFAEGGERARRRRRQRRRAARRRPARSGLFDEYVGDAEANAAAFRDGNYYSGDKAWRDGDGYLWFEGATTTSSPRRLPDRPLRGGVGAGRARRGGRGGGRRPRRPASGPRSSRAFVVLAAGQEGGDDLAAELQTHTRELDRPVQVPPRDPLRRGAAENDQRQDPPLPAPRRTRGG